MAASVPLICIPSVHDGQLQCDSFMIKPLLGHCCTRKGRVNRSRGTTRAMGLLKSILAACRQPRRWIQCAQSRGRRRKPELLWCPSQQQVRHHHFPVCAFRGKVQTRGSRTTHLSAGRMARASVPSARRHHHSCRELRSTALAGARHVRMIHGACSTGTRGLKHAYGACTQAADVVSSRCTCHPTMCHPTMCHLTTTPAHHVPPRPLQGRQRRRLQQGPRGPQDSDPS
jgi:hypothetical protein